MAASVELVFPQVRIYYQPNCALACEITSAGRALVTPRPPNLAYELLEARALAQVGAEVEFGTRFLGPWPRPDLVIAATELAAPLARDTGVPFIVRWMANYDPNSSDLGYRAATDAAMGAIGHYASCSAIAKSVEPYVGARVALVPHPVVTPPPEALLHAVRDIDCLFVGWLSEIKRVELLIGACEEAGRSLGIVGTGSEAPRLVDRAKGASVPITFFGPLFDESLSAVYLRAARYLSASVSDSWAVPIGEALAHGCAVAHYDNPGIREPWAGADIFWWKTQAELVDWLKRPVGEPRRNGPEYVLARGYNAAAAGRALLEFAHFCLERNAKIQGFPGGKETT